VDIQKAIECPQRSQAAIDRGDSVALLPAASDIGVHIADRDAVRGFVSPLEKEPHTVSVMHGGGCIV
jgi:hypothetical protein